MRTRVVPTAVMMALALTVTIAVAGGDFGAVPRVAAEDATPVAAVAAFRPTHAVATSQSLNLRAGPTMASPIAAALAPGAPVASLGETVERAGGETWLSVATADGLVGWVRAFDLDPIDEPGADGSDPTVTPPGPEAAAVDPIVGAWGERRNRGDHLTFFADGNALLTDAEGRTFHGSWRRVDHPDLIGTYVVQAWGRDGGEGRLGPIVRVSADELDLGDGVYDRLVPPSPNELSGRRDDPASAAGQAQPAPPRSAPGSGAAPAATPVADETASTDDPFPGVAIEGLANVRDLPTRPPLGQATLSRVTIEPGAVFDYPFPYPVLVAVEEGSLTVAAFGPGVTVTSPPEVIEGNPRQSVRDGEGLITLDDGGMTVQQRVRDIAPREAASVEAGGSVSAEGGAIGALRNEGDDRLVLLLVALGPEGRRWAETGRADAIAVPETSHDGRGPQRPPQCRVEPRTREDVERVVAESGRPNRGSPRMRPTCPPAN